MMRRSTLLASAAALSLALPATVSAQTTPVEESATDGASSRLTAYEAATFAQYAPRTALDIARRVPGFNLDLGNNDVRGFGGAAGNVVINGARPSSKSESLESILSRIPASSVTKVEVGPGDLFGAEYAGKSQVLNIVMSTAGGVDGNVSASLRRLYTGTIVPNGSASALIRKGASTISLSANAGNFLGHEEGTDTLFNLATGERLEYRRKFNSYFDRNPNVSASWALERAPDKAIRINGRWSARRFDLQQDNRVSPANGPQRDDTLIQDYSNPVFEIGGDITRPLAGGAIKFIALATRRKRDNFDTYIARDGLLEDDPTEVGGFEQTQTGTAAETIGRLVWSRQDLGGFSFEAGGEAVLNALDSTVELFLIEPGGGRTRIDLPIDDAKVEEKRGELFVKVGKSLTPNFRADGGLTFEYSDLTVSGDTSAERKLKFFKPNLTLDWKPGNDWHTQLAIRRTVAQLDFFDFISVAELSNDRVNAGNENLVPQRAWEFRLTVDRPILGKGLAKVELGHDLISLLQDRVLVFDDDGNAFDAPGNIGTGKRWFGRLTLDAPLPQLWSGLRVKFEGMVQRTRVEDPVNGRMRDFSGYYPAWEWSLDFRRDSGKFSYGLEFFDRARFTFFRTDEFDTMPNDGPYAEAFVEYRPDQRWAIRFDVDNLRNSHGLRERDIFLPNRDSPVFSIKEFRERSRHVTLGLTVKRSFGGGGAKTP
jgi:hypothetical protein